MRSSMGSALSFFVILFVFVITVSYAMDTINKTHSMKDGDTLVSSGGNFEMGFFPLGSSNRWYLGIWYKKVSLLTPVWVANRKVPLLNSSGVLKMEEPGVLVLVNGNGSIIWSTNFSRTALLQNPVAELLDSGNLVIRESSDNNPDNFVWQSFDYPCDTHLAGMKLGWNLVTGFERYLTSWASSDDPSPGNYSYSLDREGYPQLVLRKGSVVQYRSGPWNGLRFSGIPGLKPNPVYTYRFVFDQNETYYAYELKNTSVVTRRVLNPYGQMQRVLWNDRSQGWTLYLAAQADNCDSYGLCGPFGVCNMAKSPECGCLKGFFPKSGSDWESGYWSDGCVRPSQLDCKKGDGFIKLTNVKVPDTRYSWFNTSMSLRDCEKVCLQNCSCTAYTNLDIRHGGSGCLLWFGDLLDIEEYDSNGQDLYVRIASSEIGKLGSSWRNRSLIAALSTIATVLLLCTAIILCLRRKKQKDDETNGRLSGRLSRRLSSSRECSTVQRAKEESELPLFEFYVVAQATDNFSIDNKIGQGGFGSVYKGILKDGQEIAVKRLSKDSAQGIDEFKNEVKCIAELQHRNLVKLLGYCIRGEERMLIYEYLPNKSLDYYIFGKTERRILDWPKRLNIINGIARGLLYLHQDSRLRIVHRDLKAGNILLDQDWNPKISDFGIARSFLGNECMATTQRVVGTYGYMSPEYAIDGHFSVKSDVFSFGVLVLEIISGKRNRGYNHKEHQHNLLGHAWRLYSKGETLKLVDPSINLTDTASQMLRSIQVGLLCVQQSPDDRPSMSEVVVMLSSDNELPQTKEPGFFIARIVQDVDSGSSKASSSPNHELSMTFIDGR